MSDPTKVKIVTDETAAKAATYSALADTVAFAQNKSHISIFNGSTNKKVSIYALNPINLSLAAVTGVGVRFDIKRLTALHTGGTDIVLEKSDGYNAALSGITVKTGASVTEGTTIKPFVTNNDEIVLTGVAGINVQQSIMQLLPIVDGVTQPFVLRPGEGLHVKQITNSVVGSFAWTLAFTVEDNAN